MSELFNKYRKALAGAVTAGVTYVVVTKLGGSEELAIAFATPLTGLITAWVENVTHDIDEALSTSAVYEKLDEWNS